MPLRPPSPLLHAVLADALAPAAISAAVTVATGFAKDVDAI